MGSGRELETLPVSAYFLYMKPSYEMVRTPSEQSVNTFFFHHLPAWMEEISG